MNMDDSINRDLTTISRWGELNRVNFNALKTQCCLLTHKRLEISPESVLRMGNSTVGVSDNLLILGTRIQCDVRWNRHIFDVAKETFRCLGFLRRCRTYFSPPDLLRIYTSFIRPKMEYNSHIWAGAARSSLELLDRVQRRAVDLVGDETVTRFIDTLEHRRNVGSLSLFYRYYHGRCSADISNLIPNTRTFIRSTRLSHRSHPFAINLSIDRTTHYRENSFFGRTIRMWNLLPANVFPAEYNIYQFKSNVNKHYSLFPPSHNFIS